MTSDTCLRAVRVDRYQRRYDGYREAMSEQRDIDFVFEAQPDGGYYVHAPDFPGLHTQGDELEGAMANAREALELYVDGLADD